MAHKVIVGMSGGVDSSVTAALLKKNGLDVEGVSLQLWERRGPVDPTSCCSLESARMAARVAEILGIPHRTVDARGAFAEDVIEPFGATYDGGRTPNPCILCNEAVKFPLLMKSAEEQGARFIATGHYARLRRFPSGAVELHRGLDPKKDQSYFLYSLDNRTLNSLLLPLGTRRKKEIRAEAARLGFPVAERPESQEICFVGDEGYQAFIGELSGPAEAGPIVDQAGRRLGTHRGITAYTLGQRRGLGVSSTDRLYVIDIRPEENTVVVGPRSAAYRSRITVRRLCWHITPPAAGVSFSAEVRIRSTTSPKPATITLRNGETADVVSADPLWAPAPGQAAVFYQNSRVIGGGEIAREG